MIGLANAHDPCCTRERKGGRGLRIGAWLPDEPRTSRYFLGTAGGSFLFFW